MCSSGTPRDLTPLLSLRRLCVSVPFGLSKRHTGHGCLCAALDRRAPSREERPGGCGNSSKPGHAVGIQQQEHAAGRTHHCWVGPTQGRQRVRHPLRRDAAQGTSLLGSNTQLSLFWGWVGGLSLAHISGVLGYTVDPAHTHASAPTRHLPRMHTRRSPTASAAAAQPTSQAGATSTSGRTSLLRRPTPLWCRP